MSNRDKTHDTDISTMVHHVLLNCEIYPLKLVSLLSLRYIKKKKFSTKKKIDLPKIETPGEIISSSFRSIKRGIIRSVKSNFKNAVSIDIASNSKFINLRISPTTMQGYGSNSDDVLKEAVGYAFQHIEYIQYILDRMKQNPELTDRTINCIKEKTKGQEFMVIKSTDIIVNSANMQYYNNFMSDGYNHRRRVGRMLDYQLVQSIERSIETNKKILSEYRMQETLCYILNVLLNEKMHILIKLKSEVLIYPNSASSPIENSDNYINTLSYIISACKITIHSDPDTKANILYYIFDDSVHTIRDISIINYFQDIHAIIEKFRDKPIYKEVEFTNKLTYPNMSTDNTIDYVIADYLLRLIDDYKHHDAYCTQLDWIRSVDRVYDGELSIKKIKYISLNFNYNLGHRLALRKLIHEFNNLDGFNAERDQHTQKYVTIQIPYTLSPETIEYIQKGAKSTKLHHSFLIYANGSVTQSGPLYEMNVQAYNMFINAFESLVDKIIRNENPRTSGSPKQYAQIE